MSALLLAALALATPVPAAPADDLTSVETVFDQTFTAPRAARTPDVYQSAFATRVAQLAEASRGRIGVAAIDLQTGRGLDVLGDQPFPLASTSKIAIAATFLDGVDRGRFSLDAMYPLMIALPSRRFDGAVAPVRAGAMLPARTLIDLSLTRSDNQATDALLAAIGGPRMVDAWLKRAGITDFHIDHDITTLVRDDGAFDPATHIDRRDATTPEAMVALLSGLYRGQWLSPASQQVLLGTMSRCVTGRRRMRANLPETALVAHKTGTLANTSSDVGIVTLPDGRAFALAIYVTGQGNKLAREERIATIARAVYDGYAIPPTAPVAPAATPVQLQRTASR